MNAERRFMNAEKRFLNAEKRFLQTKIGIYGMNGHQINNLKHDRAYIVAAACCGQELDGVKTFNSLEEMLADPEIDMISLCSPRRADQARQAIACMEAGKHVFAEKPCAMSIKDLDMIIETSKRTGKIFHEMAGTAFSEPYASMRDLVAQGVIGDVVQVFAQKSYPYHDGRPQDENIDGGLIEQAGIHAIRFIEHVAGQKIVNVSAVETSYSNPHKGGLQMAASIAMELENGGVASVISNYLNQKGFGRWGNEHLRIFGTLGFVESVDAGAKTRLVIGDDDKGAITTANRGPSFFDMILDQIQKGATPTLSIEDELHPTRVVISAKESAVRGCFIKV